MKIILIPLLVGQVLMAPQMSFGSSYEDLLNSFSNMRPSFQRIPTAFEDLGSKFGSRMQHIGQNIGSQVLKMGQEVDAFGNKMEQSIHKQVDKLPGMLEQIEDQFHGVRSNIGNQFSSLGLDLMDHFDHHMGGLGLGTLESTMLGDMFGHPRTPWWQGPNVCVEKEVVEGTPQDVNIQVAGNMHFHMQMSQCNDGEGFYECTQTQGNGGAINTLKLRYTCCHGFTFDKRKGCTKVDLKPLEETIESLGGTEFLDLLVSSGVGSLDNVTIFVPSDDAVEDFHVELEQINEIPPMDNVIYRVDDGLISYRKKRSPISIIVAEQQEIPDVTDVVQSHIIEGFINTRDIKGEEILETSDKGKLRITKYASKTGEMVTANCARVTARDQQATNGIVHMVDRMLRPAKKTVGEIIEADQQFRTFVTALEEHGLMSDLHKRDGLTVFAPTDAAFTKLDSIAKSKVLGKGGCARDVIMTHILPRVICSGVVVGKVTVKNLLGREVTLDVDEEGNILIDEVKLVIKDKMGTNGVIHVIEEVVIQDSVKNVIEHLEKKHAKKFLDLLKTSGVDKTLESMPNITLFMPSDRALSEIPISLMEEFKKDPDMLKELLLHHVTEERKSSCDLVHHQNLETLGGHHLRVNLHQHFGHTRPLAMVQCARVIQSNDEVCGGHVHTIDRLLTPPVGDLLEAVSKDHKKFAELVAFADVAEELSSKEAQTLLAPDDSAFGKLDAEIQELMFSDKEIAADVVRHHLIPDTVCCASVPRIFGFLEQRLARRSKLGNGINFRRSNGGHIYANRAALTMCDVAATNGILHTVESVILPPSIQNQNQAQRKRKGFWIF